MKDNQICSKQRKFLNWVLHQTFISPIRDIDIIIKQVLFHTYPGYNNGSGIQETLKKIRELYLMEYLNRKK